MPQQPLKIMIVVPGFPLEKERIRGGVHAAVLYLLLGFEKFPVKVRLLSIDPDFKEYKLVKWSDNVEVQYSPIRKLPNKMLSYFFYGSSLLRQQIHEFHPDILHYQIGGNFLLTKLFVNRKIPTLLTIHGIASEEAKVSQSFKRKLNMYWNGTITEFLRPRHIVNISAYSKKLVAIRNNQHHPIIYNAVSGQFFEIPVKAVMNNRLLYVGVINERKNLGLLLEAMKLLNAEGIRYQLTVVGGADRDPGYFNEQLHYAQENLKDQVDFLGWKSQTELFALLGSHDIVVLPSKQETLPMSIAEAMAAGKVVMVSDVGGLSEMVEAGKTGFLLDPNKVSEWVTVLKELFNNAASISKIGDAARSFAWENFECTLIAAGTIRYYQEILKRETQVS